MPHQGVGATLRWEHVAAAVLLGAMALIAFVNILGRYLFHYSLSFTEEITINLFVWLTVIGTGLAFERGAQLGMVTFFRLFPARLRRLLILLSAVLSAGLFVAIDLFLVRTIYYEITIFRASSPALEIPIWIYYAGVVVFSLSVFKGIYRGAASEMRKRGVSFASSETGHRE